jgi:outer membrane protein TolC
MCIPVISRAYRLLKLMPLAFSLLVIALVSVKPALAIEPELSFKQAILLAQQNDPWLVQSRYSQDSLESLSIAAGTFDDPKLGLGIANIAIDSFDFNQEPMSQVKLSYSQNLPRGDSLKLKQQQLSILAQQMPYQRQDRKAKVAVVVGQLWLDIFEAKQSIELIENNRALFQQLEDIAEANYASSIAKTKQQDLVRAQLELTQLDDRLTRLKQKKQMAEQKLSEWLSQRNNQAQAFAVGTELPNIKWLLPTRYKSSGDKSSGQAEQLNQSGQKLESSDFKQQQFMVEALAEHPAIKAVEQKLKASQNQVNLSKQAYKPQWGVNASYGVRGDAANGVSRSDLFSVGISFDLPIFTHSRQDKQVHSATAEVSKIKTEKWMLLRKLIADFNTHRVALENLEQREILYKQRLLPQTHLQAEVALTAYTNDDGGFAEVVRARIAELNATIVALGISVERQKTILQLNYFSTSQAQSKKALVGEHHE